MSSVWLFQTDGVSNSRKFTLPFYTILYYPNSYLFLEAQINWTNYYRFKYKKILTIIIGGKSLHSVTI